LIILAKPTVALVYGYGAFEQDAVTLTATALAFYAIGMIGYAYAEVLNKSFFAMQETRIPMVTALISIALNVGLSFGLSSVMGIGGLALASAITATLNAAMNFVIMSRKTSGIMQGRDVLNILKLVISAVIMAAAVWAAHTFVSPHFPGNFVGKALGFAVPAVAGAVVYLAGCFVLKASEVSIIMRLFKRSKHE
jgi:putative peptidoglycan lipid II flippase